MKNFKVNGNNKVRKYKGERIIDGINCFISDFSGYPAVDCTFTEEPEWVGFYIRLVSYSNACKIIDYAKSLGFYGNITEGGFYINASQSGWKDIINFIETLDIRYELSNNKPSDVTKKLIESYRKNS